MVAGIIAYAHNYAGGIALTIPGTLYLIAAEHELRAPIGQPLDAPAVAIAKQTFDTLRAMGFKMTEARKLIDIVQGAGAPDTLEAFVQAALRAT